MHDASYSEARSAAGGVTNGQWYRIAYMTQPTNVSTHPRGGARIIIGNQGGSLEPTRTVLEVDHGFSGLGSISLIHNVPDTDAPWRAVRIGYRDDSASSSNKTAFVDVQANETSTGAFTVLVESQPVVAYPETAYQWYATNAPISALAANEYSFCTMTNVHMLSSAFQRYSGNQYEDYGMGPLWQTPRWSTTERDAFTHQRAGSFGWNATLGRLQVYNGSAWVDVASGAGLTNTVVMIGGTNTVIGPDFTGIPGVSHGYFGIASSNQVIFQLWSHGVPLDRLDTTGASPGNPIVFNGTDFAATNALSVATLNAGTLAVSNRMDASVITGAVSRVAVYGATGILTNAPATTGTGSPVFSDSPALTGTPTIPTAATGTSNTVAASTEFVAKSIVGLSGVGITNIGTTGYALFFTETNINGTTAYTTNTFSVPTNRTIAHCWIVGLGGGGGSGRVGPTNTVNAGGAGGGGGGRYYFSWPVSNLVATSSNMTVLVPNRLPGGASISATNSNGNAGDNDLRYVWVYSGTNVVGFAQSGGSGAGGNSSGASAGSGGSGPFAGAGGSASSGTGGAGSNGPQLSNGGASGGASGGGLNVANTASGGGTGAGASWLWNGGGGGVAGSAGGGSGGDGGINAGFEWLLKGGPSGGGGGSNPTGNGGAGGAGGYFGGGGGGGGAAQDGYSSGAGGPGGPAGVLIIFD